MITTESSSIQALVAEVTQGKIKRPEIQRRYVWKPVQVRNFFDSLYRGYPSGEILEWETDELPNITPLSVGGISQSQTLPRLLLDGQQRLTSLVAVMTGKPIILSKEEKPVDIVFNLLTEEFEVARGPIKHKQGGWYSLSQFFTSDPFQIMPTLTTDPKMGDADMAQVSARLTRLYNIKNYTYHIIVLKQMDYAEVTKIFIRVNSGGSRLSNADLALAQVSSQWQGVTEEFEQFSEAIKKKYQLELGNDLLVRIITAIATRQVILSRLFKGEQRPAIGDLQSAWQRAKGAIIQSIAFIVGNCKIDRMAMLPTRNVIIPLVVYFDQFANGGNADALRELQRWLYMALIWSRYSGAVETSLNEDIATLIKFDGTAIEKIQRMIQSIEDKVGRRPVTERTLIGQQKNSAFDVLAYVLARRNQAKDPFTGVSIDAGQPLDYQRIFTAAHTPKETPRFVANELANLVYVTSKPFLGAKAPAAFLANVDPDWLKAQHIPLDPHLWQADQFEAFIADRRRLLADGINNLLYSLGGTVISDETFLESRVDVTEKSLRALINQRLLEGHGVQAWEVCIPLQIRNTVQHHINEQLQQQPYLQGTLDSMEAKLRFTLFSDAKKIILANWDAFADLFADRDNFVRNLDYVIDARNALKHGNGLSNDQRAFAEGALIWLDNSLQRAEQSEDETQLEDEVA